MVKRVLFLVWMVSLVSTALFSLDYQGKIKGTIWPEGSWSVTVTPNNINGSGDNTITMHVDQIEFGFNMSHDNGSGTSTRDIIYGVNNASSENAYYHHQHTDKFTVSLHHGANSIRLFFKGETDYSEWEKHIVVYYYPPAVNLILNTADGLTHTYSYPDPVNAPLVPLQVNNSAVVSRKLTVVNKSTPGDSVTYSVGVSNNQVAGDFTEFGDGNYIVNFTVTDRLGRVHYPKHRVFTDRTKPEILVTPPTAQWVNLSSAPNAYWTVSVKDVTTGVAETGSGYKIGYSPTALTNPSLATYPPNYTLLFNGNLGAGEVRSRIIRPSYPNSDGYYYLQIAAVDIAGNSVHKFATDPIQYDNTGPLLGTPTLQVTASGKISVSWSIATDSSSGMSSSTPYTLFATADGANNAGQFSTITSQGGQNSAIITPNSSVHGNQVTVRVAAHDNVGNTTMTQASIGFPSPLTLTTSLGVGDAQNMEVDIQFGVSPEQLAKYNSLSIARTGAFSLSTLSIFPATIMFDSQGQFVPSTLWGISATGRIYYKDLIPINSHAGHRSWTYKLSSIPNLGDIEPSTVALPNNPGNVELSVFDMSGNAYQSSNFMVESDGKLKIQIQGTDHDRDNWTAEIDKITQVRQNGVALSSYRRISGNAAFPYNYDATNGYPSSQMVVTLVNGHNYVCLAWTEGTDSQTYYSEIKDIQLTTLTAGGFSITITDVLGSNLGTDDSGILTTQPGQELQFTIAGAPDPITWDFGDSSPTGTGASQTHAYHQKVDQTTDSCSYTLTITAGGTTLNMPVVVVDTREGELYEDEVWRGSHQVTGIVEVPNGKTLTLAGSQTISFLGSIGSGYLQGIQVAAGGNLNIASGSVFQKGSTQVQGWGTIKVLGTAVFTGAEVRDADRGITCIAGSTVTLTGVNCHDNVTGLQVLGNAVVHVTNSDIQHNSLFGIKEDGGGRPTLTGTTIKNNFRNYYQWDAGLLGIGAINSLGLNSGNQGE